MDYARLVETARRLIAKSGQPVLWVQQDDPQAADPSMPWKPAASPSTNEIKVSAVFLPLKAQSSVFLSMMKDADDVPQGEVLVLIAGTTAFEPQMTDYLNRDDSILRPVKIKTLRPAATTILHMIAMKR